jgi:hypothetical protein
MLGFAALIASLRLFAVNFFMTFVFFVVKGFLRVKLQDI